MKNHISVCVCTFYRNEMLARLLEKLAMQNSGDLFDLSVVVVDNSPVGHARQTVKRLMDETALDITYGTEPHQNIALARNRAVNHARGDLIALIDDDEYPDADWLFCLYNAINEHRANGVMGPVLPSFDTEPPGWVLKGCFFERPAHPTGHILEWQNTRTGNALLRKDLFRKDCMWFDPTFGSGGEDRDFFRRKIAEGHVFTWCNEARVFETVPPARWERRVMLKRALLRGKMALNSTEARALSVLYSMTAVSLYTLCLPVLLISGHHIFMKYLIKDFDHVGKLLAFLGIDLVREKYVVG